MRTATEYNFDIVCDDIVINVDALVEAVEKATSTPVFQDSYGDGVALVDGVSFNTFHDLAENFGLCAVDFTA